VGRVGAHSQRWGLSAKPSSPPELPTLPGNTWLSPGADVASLGAAERSPCRGSVCDSSMRTKRRRPRRRAYSQGVCAFVSRVRVQRNATRRMHRTPTTARASLATSAQVQQARQAPASGEGVSTARMAGCSIGAMAGARAPRRPARRPPRPPAKPQRVRARARGLSVYVS
jgi:hypothetical protein